MVVLALDTTTRAGSCALSSDGVVTHERASDPATSHAEQLPGDLIALLDVAQRGLDAVDVFAVAIGPGSFTGLRVGIATMQGLAFAMGKPLIGVSALDALASLVRPRSGERVATWVDAWRGEVYAALYEDGCEVESPTVEHPVAILQRLADWVSEADRHGPPHREGLPRRVLFVGDGAGRFADLIRSALGEGAMIADPVWPVLAGAVARLAGEAAHAGVRPAPDAIRPMYVRRTDVELTRDARTGQ